MSIPKISEPDLPKIANWQEYTEKTDSIPWLKEHRDWVEENKWGYGDRALHYMWYELIRELPYGSNVLEIGVFRGQTLSLWGLISGLTPNSSVGNYGITPLNTQGDKYTVHPDHAYLQDIYTICDKFYAHPQIWKGLSTDWDSITWASRRSYALIFIDGGHDEETVKADIENYSPLVKPEGYLVIDDSANNVETSDHWFRGLEEVSQVVDRFAAETKDFKEVLRCGYVRVFQRA